MSCEACADSSVDSCMSAAGLLLGEVFCNEESEKFGSICSFIENSLAVQGQTPARQNSRGKAETELNTRREVRAGGKQSQSNKHNPSRGRQQTIRITSKQSKVR